MSSSDWVKEHAGQIVVALVIVVIISLVMLPVMPSSGMADLCVRRPMCVHECCPSVSGFKSEDGALTMVKKKLGL